ncbi:outer membrane lipoprotein Omp16 [Polymorphobacter glacialis]|uniref:Peptidoglycan-associated protein n=2 Tax=Sandarakinorhabdus glacialis TaxID=1614636 RepID=A0A916ZNW2_9SPHN|nr:outer membrane lipoprotein Omp16 [Polymorphobacter glacialis]
MTVFYVNKEIGMSQRLLSLPLIAALAITVSACATKKKDLPPPPPTATTPSTPGTGLDSGTGTPPVAGVGNANIPGSAADFAAQSGTDTVLFQYDSYEIDDEARTILGKQAEWLARYPNVRVTVEGHADERGTREYNLALGDRRATAAKNFLAAQGVGTSRMTTISYGKERPVAEGSDEAAWALNRRSVTVVASAS